MYGDTPNYMNSQQGLASLVNSPYGDSDVMQVKMTPREVAGLQQLAMSYGANEQDLYDPVTGEPRFSFLKKILPMVAGAFLGPGGAGIFKTSLGAATAVGLGYGLIEGDLKKGLMAGLGAYSGAKIGEGLTAAGTATSQVASAPPPTASLKDTAFKISADSVGQDLPLSSLRQTPISVITGKSMIPVQPITQAPPMPVPETTAPTGTFGTMGQGVKNLFASDATGNAARQAFGETFSNPFSRYATMFGVANALTPEQKPLSVPGMGEDIVYIPGGFNPQYGTGADQPPQLQGRYYKRTSKGLVPYNPWAKGFADGGIVTNPLDVQSNVTESEEDPNVLANRAYVEELNRRALNPVINPYGLNYAGGLGGTNTPWTGTNPYGGPLNPPATGGQTSTGGGAGDVAAFLATQVGINWMMQPGNAVALKDWITGGMKWADRPFLNADKAGTGTGTGTNTGGQQTQTGGNQTQTGGQQTQTGGDQTQTGNQQTQTGGDGSPKFDPVKNIVIAGGTSAAAIAAAKALAASKGVIGVYAMDGTLIAGGGAGAATGAAGAAGAATGTGAATTGAAGTTAGGAGAGGGGTAAGGAGSQTGIASTLKGGATAAGTAAAAAAALIGAHQAYQGISKGREGQAAAGGALAGAGGAYLAGASGLGGAGLTSLAGFGPVGLAAAALAAIGASMVNTKEYGDVALRNYWNAVDSGRGIGQTDPNELAQGFINFYRTNKNEFAGQEKYGRTGNEEFVYDMTQVINNAVKDGKVNKDVDAATMYKQVVQPWLNSMGSGPKDEKARSIQDFMVTDLINSFMQGKPISNAQVKGDKKFKIVSEKPVYAGIPTAQQQTLAAKDKDVEDYIRQNMQQGPIQGYRNIFNPTTPYAASQPVRANREIVEEPMYMGDMSTLSFADGGAIGDDYNFGFAMGGMPEYKAGGKLLDGPGDGMSDSIPAVIRGKGVQRAALADGEFVIPADVVSHLGNGSTKAGAKKLYTMMNSIRQARTGTKRQAPAVKPERFIPA